MDKLLIDPLTRKQIDNYCLNPGHALLLQGEKGTGTFTVAQAIASRIVNDLSAIICIEPEKGTIAIDTVRELYAATRSTRNEALVVIINDADAMGGEAQNALLKLLEEPPLHVHFILTTHAAHHLLDTVLSRTEHISLRLISKTESASYLKSSGIVDATEQAKLLFLASGKPAELHRLIDDKEYYEACSLRMGDARKFLEEDSYGRLILLKKYMTDRIAAEAFLIMIGQLLSYTLYRSVTLNSVTALDAVNEALEALNRNGNVRAQLLRLSNSIA